MPRRMGRPGLVRTVGRTAVIAGTATAVSGGVSRHASNNAAQQQQEAATQQQDMVDQAAAQAAAQVAAQQPPPPPVAAPAPAAADPIAQLTQLADLKAAGALTDAEFTAAKAQVLGS